MQKLHQLTVAAKIYNALVPNHASTTLFSDSDSTTKYVAPDLYFCNLIKSKNKYKGLIK